MGESSHDRLTSGFTKHQHDMLRVCALYRDEARELRGDRSYEVTVTERYLLYHMHDGVLAPIPKSAL